MLLLFFCILPRWWAHVGKEKNGVTGKNVVLFNNRAQEEGTMFDIRWW
jgi:hypothetical protein